MLWQLTMKWVCTVCLQIQQSTTGIDAQSSLLQKELELPQSYYVVHRYKLHKHTQQSSGDNIYNNNGWGCNIIHNNQKGESYSVENVHHIWQSVFSMRTNTEYNNQPRVLIPNQQRTAFSSKCGIGKNYGNSQFGESAMRWISRSVYISMCEGSMCEGTDRERLLMVGKELLVERYKTTKW